METQNTNKNLEPIKEDGQFNRGRAIAGLIVVVVGVTLLARQMGVDFPYWFFSWPMLLIAIGLYVGFRHSFRNPGWLFPVGIGTLFLLEDILPTLEIKQYIWPIIIISVGLFMIFRPRGRRQRDYWKDRQNKEYTSEYFSNNAFDTVTIFGGEKKQIISKDFKGGESTCFF